MESRRTIITPLDLRADSRGIVFEPLNPEDLAIQKNAHLVLTLPGRVRGNHYHRSGTEVVAVVGPALARIREAGKTQDVDVPSGSAFRFVIPPGVAHAFQNRGSDVMVLLAFNTSAHDPARPDTVRDVLIEEKPLP